MVTPRILALGLMALVAGCGGGFPTIRPIASASDAAILSRFERTYSAGKASMQNDRVGLALVLFQKALALNPESVAALNAVGAAYDELHFPDMAARYYARALVLEPGGVDTLNNMAVSAVLAGKKEQARKLFEMALGIDGGNGIVRTNMRLLDLPRLARAGESEESLSNRPAVERIGMAVFQLSIRIPPLAPSLQPLGRLPERLPATLPEILALNR